MLFEDYSGEKVNEINLSTLFHFSYPHSFNFIVGRYLPTYIISLYYNSIEIKTNQVILIQLNDILYVVQ